MSGEEFGGWTKVHSFSYNGIVKTFNKQEATYYG